MNSSQLVLAKLTHDMLVDVDLATWSWSSITIGRWSEPKAVIVEQLVAIRKSGGPG